MRILHQHLRDGAHFAVRADHGDAVGAQATRLVGLEGEVEARRSHIARRDGDAERSLLAVGGNDAPVAVIVQRPGVVTDNAHGVNRLVGIRFDAAAAEGVEVRAVVLVVVVTVAGVAYASRQ